MNYSIEEQLKIIQAGRYSLIDFSILTNRKYKPNWHHQLIAKELEKAENGTADWKILLIMCPPRSGKSQEASINFPAWYLGRNPDKEIITSSYSADLALDFGGKTRDLISSDEYKLIFGNVSLKQDEQSKAKWRTNQGGSYISVGIGGALTGRGADILIIDDPIKNREEAESEVVRNSHWSWFTSTAYTRLEPNGKVVIILTRWHLDDLAGRIMANPEFASLLKVIVFPAIAEEDDKYRKKGEVLWPSRYPLAEVESIRRGIGMYDFSSLYQQKPILSENQEFKPHWFIQRDWQEVLTIETRNFLTIDTAVSQKASGDYTGICRNYVDRENKWNIKAKRMRLNPKELIDLIFALNDQDRYEKIGIEKTIYLDAIKPFLDDEMRKRDKYLNIVPLEHREIAKEIRIRGLIPRYESRSIIHIKGECADLEEELLTFPKGMHDDVLDSLAYQVQIAEAPIGFIDEELRIQENRDSNLKNEFFER